VKPTRRTVIRAAGLALAAPALATLRARPLAAATGDRTWLHGLSLYDELKYPEGFKHFDYVNPDAPKAGTLRFGVNGTFDNLNMVVQGVKGVLGAGVDNLYDALMVGSSDEVSTMYGQIAEAVTHPADFSSVTYRLRASAKWHDGRPVTPEDVIFSLEAFKKYNARMSGYYNHVVKAEKTGEREVTFTFDGPGNRELPQIVGQLFVLPKHWWEETNQAGQKRNIGETMLEAPLGCGAYRLKEFIPGRTIVYELVKDYWGKDLNVNVGRDNFETLRFEYFRDANVTLEAFKADQLDWRTENVAKNWATAYKELPAVLEKRMILEEFKIRSQGVMQAFAFNTRRDKFKDARLRRAFNFAFDFEEMNKQIFYGQYTRIASYWEGIEDLMSSGLPQGEELAILETVRDKVPPEVFTTVYKNPVGGNAEAVRANLREAIRLCKDAGYEVRERKLVNVATGEQLSVEILVYDATFERPALFYKPSLERLGINVTIRTIDVPQYEQRLRQWDFDILGVESWPETLSPGNEQRDNWGSKAADMPGSNNTVGIKNPAVDALIDRVIFAKNRRELEAATKALDRVLLWNHFVVPQWTYGKQRTARWDRFGRPAELPKYAAAAFPTVWWWDAERARKIGAR
jgi:microcin C transport system substrate-binding protein